MPLDRVIQSDLRSAGLWKKEIVLCLAIQFSIVILHDLWFGDIFFVFCTPCTKHYIYNALGLLESNAWCITINYIMIWRLLLKTFGT